ncbi:hypothetical protein ACVWWH_000713 [Sinomonas sp. RB5]
MPVSGDGSDRTAARDPSTFTVTGGEAFRVNAEALQEAAASLTAALSCADAVIGRLESARAAAWRGVCAGSATGAAFDARAADLVGQAMRAALDLRSARDGVAAAKAGYLAAEGWAAIGGIGLPLGARLAVSGLVPSGYLWNLIGIPPGRLGAAALRGVATAVGDTVPGLSPWMPAGAPDDRISVVRHEVAPGSGDASTFAYAAESLRQAQGAAPLEDGTPVPPSSVLVERIPRADGSTAVVVTVPGTQSWAPDDAQGGVFDIEGNLDGMDGRDSHARQLIERALADQELMAGDSVVFNAHSQGSLHVLGLLGDKDFRSRYPVAAVTLLGGIPTAFPIPEDIPALTVSNEADVVPALSGSFPVPRPNVVDVQTPEHADGGGIVGAHDITQYAADARALDLSSDPSVRGYASVLGTVVGTGVVGAGVVRAAGGGATPTAARRERFVYTGTDTTTPLTPRLAGGAGAPSPSAGPGPSR